MLCLAADPLLVLGEARDGAVLEDGRLGRPRAGELLGHAPTAPWSLFVALGHVSRGRPEGRAAISS